MIWHCFQLLKVWLKDSLVAAYNVRDLIEELREWVEDGFLKADIWSTLQKKVNPALLSTDICKVEQVKETRINYNCNTYYHFNKNIKDTSRSDDN